MTQHQYMVADRDIDTKKDIAHSLSADTVEDAEDMFVDAKERLLDINNWRKYTPTLTGEFQLIDANGKELHRKAHKGDHVRISASGAVTGWMIIEGIEYDDYPDADIETFTLHLNTSAAPAQNTTDVHNAAAITVLVERRQWKLFVNCHGANGSLPLGLSYSQWDSLTTGLIDDI